MATRTPELGHTSVFSSVSSRRRHFSEISLDYALLAPAVILLLVFEFFSRFYGMYIGVSFRRISCVRIMGFDNYMAALPSVNPDLQ